ncbi:hypothetical protein GJU84_04785 [Staphylococcus chromogenes]|nr:MULTISPECIES: hypothetical protein [Staphylococcus]ALN76032.1 hypothetical protein EP23_00990 [Staphylococcus agnetis]MDG4944740.1 hypothetical protein [Staphylococcus agnetis]NJI12063.1 hypothetical protein [Staphylococcus agnetis]QIN26377.1 hypothetical protein GJU84_04785 [Staphylococcus chromogenes]
MVKIKRKVEMTQKEFVQFLIENAAINEITQSTKNGKDFELCIKLKSDNNKINRINNNLVEVEVEEEIAEDTVIPMLIEVTEYNDDTTVFLNENKSIKTVLDDSLDDLLYDPKAFYMLNDDMTMTLLWKDGGMVE